MTEQIKFKAGATSSHEAQSLVRVMRWYEKSDDRLVGEIVLNALELPELQKLFQESADNLMVDSYPVSMTQAVRLQNEIEEPIDLITYDYFLECDSA
jgi:hypothetical protein